MLTLVFYHIHGLIKSSGLEIGRDADNGGQTRYVYDLCEAISTHEDVEKIIIIARKINDPAVSDEYNVETEIINSKFEIHRLEFGGKDYLPKEDLWDHLDELVDNSLKHFKKHNIKPDWMHSHYGDAGYVCAKLSLKLNIPFAHTGHSLGIPKQEKMHNLGMNDAEAEERFNFNKRIEAEDSVLGLSEFIITSTYQEISEWEKYQNFDNARIQVLPPGTNTDKFLPYYHEYESDNPEKHEHEQRKYWVAQTIDRFLTNPAKPAILALCRPDRKKNLHFLIETYGKSKELQALSNLIIFAGIRKDINNMPEGEKEVLTEMLLLLDKYDLYGKMAIPKRHDIENEVSYIYNYAAERRGIFTNLALYENFGLTTIEAAATGLPIVATKNGGPSEVLPKIKNGILVDPTNMEDIKDAFLKILTDDARWRIWSNNGIKNVRKYYSWQAHSDLYIGWVLECLKPKEYSKNSDFHISKNKRDRLMSAKKMIISDIDGTLILNEDEHPGLDKLKDFLRENKDDYAFGVASGRNHKLIENILNELEMDVDIMVSSVGSNIHYDADASSLDKDWHTYIDFKWDRDRLIEKLRVLDWIELQEEENQNPFKLSYYTEAGQYDEDALRDALGKRFYHINVIYSVGKFLDIMPMRSSKGNAIRYLCQKWNFSMKNVYACGDSGNDTDMFRRPIKGIIVGNRSKELDRIPEDKYIYKAKKKAAEGIMEGIHHYTKRK